LSDNIVTRTSLKVVLWNWLPVVLWLILIGIESTDALSSMDTGGLLYGTLTAVFGPIDRPRFELFHGVLRKTGHFVGYGMLSLLSFRALRATSGRLELAARARINALHLRWAALAVLFTFVVAGLDEWHQSFLPSRTGEFRDVLLDTAGALVVQAVILVTLQLRNQRHETIAAN
jgi:VanZ family protein